MKHEFRLADIGEGLEEAEIINWLVKVGDRVDRDQPLIEVMTDKSNAELPAPESGIVVALGGDVGDVISVGELVAVIEQTPSADHDPANKSVAAEPVATEPPSAEVATAPASPDVSSPEAVRPRPKASPSTRRAAADRGIDLATITGTGPGGRILLHDLDTAAEPAATSAATSVVATLPSPAPAVTQASATPGLVAGVVPLRGVRRAVAKNMAQSWSEIPHIHALDQIDAVPLMELRSTLRAKGGPAYSQVTPLTFFVAAVAKALAAHPEANASINMDDETITSHGSVNVGVAVAAPQGLVVPVVHAAERLDFASLATTLAALVGAAREGTLPREQYMSGTVTITNFGALGGEQAMPLIRPPEAMIVGFGSIAERPFVIDQNVVARSTMHTVVGADHRLLDGDTTTAVLRTIGALLADPLQLVL